MKLARPSINPGRTKNIIHGVQGFIIFLAWACTIAVFTKGDGIDGRSAWYWALCWFSIPGLIYLVAVPMWPRARRFGNVYAFATVDCLYALLWFTAWVCVASYVAQGKSEGKDSNQEDKDKDSDKKTGCDNWKYGSASKCKISTATCIMGVVILYVSDAEAAFSSNPAHDFEEEDDFRSGRAGGMGSSVRSDRDEDYALLHQSEVDEFGNPSGRTAMHGAYDPTASNAGGSVLHDYNTVNTATSYGGAHGQHYAPNSEYAPPSEWGMGSSVSGYGR
ncbi:unnamed protein product [Aspergillus oryzae]|uniref:Unnamed protein product n=2 Tax=Aspergillus oryzae TaxID=5062 RepID=A0AAN4Y8Z9_ASPOZ|nr:unnamed protein product [Aspergillus oryzae]GMF85404.1 unnamed protein product [Aspergillus oryzae]GMG04229.1 unnamed protein product [Aspergillus oryzae]GMG23288.1 unnamed protein product [Aspergillus oryzae]GMG42801.1 unnamed protein product [Aspergillus oryzae var. brunneus]